MGDNFKLTHVLHCAKGDYTNIGQIEITETFTKINHDVCYEVGIESSVQLLEENHSYLNSSSTDDNFQLKHQSKSPVGVPIQRSFF